MRENRLCSSYGEGLESDRDKTQIPRQSLTRQLDFRNIKITLGMDVLRCKSPRMLEKEIWAHLFGYNIVRSIMMDAAKIHNVSPRMLSFKETLQLMEHFKHLIWNQKWPRRMNHYLDLLNSIKDRVKNRPGRLEPRALKHNPKKYYLLKGPRSEAKHVFWKKGSAYAKRKRDLAASS